MTGTVSAPRFTMAYRAGKIILYARSPVIPKSTSASDWTAFRFCSFISSSFLFGVPAKLLPQRREQPIGVVGIAAGFKTSEQRRANNRHRHLLIDSRGNGPARLARIRDPAFEIL